MQEAAAQIPLFPEPELSDPLAGLSIRTSKRARRMSIKVWPRGSVEVVVPVRTRAADVRAFVSEHSDWIAKTRMAFAERHPPEPFRLPDRISLPAIDRRVGVHYEPREDAGSVRYRLTGDILRLAGRTGDAALCTAALKRWLAGMARTHLEPRLVELSRQTGQPYRRLRVAGQKTCWGSHSSSGTLSINYCLLFLRPELVRYLLIHELCHAEHMNHSRRFWALVRSFEPRYRGLDRQLSEGWRHIPTWVGLG